jgi:hypothetical protein
MAGPNIVKYLQYRQYEAARIEASNSMMALLAGAQLATHLLQLTEGSNRLLPEVFPQVQHIKRFNLTTETANQILQSADEHLGAMGVPYALALHEDHLKTCISLLELAGLCRSGTAESSKLVNQHDTIAAATGGNFGPIARAQIDTLRHMRNCLIHSGGRAGNALVTNVSGWSTVVDSAWVGIAQRSPRGLAKGDPITFSQGEMILALAVTKTLDREANDLLRQSLPRDQWADMVINDLSDQAPAAIRSSVAVRKAKGIARHYYSALSLTEAELVAALARAR